MDAVYAADSGAVVHDTRKQGRPDLVRLTWDAVQGFQAEAVIVISNEKLTKKVVYGMETRGVPAYGGGCYIVDRLLDLCIRKCKFEYTVG